MSQFCFSCSCFTCSCCSEECKAVAAYALGNVTVGNVPTLLPTILDALNESKHQYLLLTALKEVIVFHHQRDKFLELGTDNVNQISPILLKYCESPKEGIRNVVADCVGSLFIQQPHIFIDIVLQTMLKGTASAKWAMATALKYVVSSGFPLQGLEALPQLLPQVSPLRIGKIWSCIYIVSVTILLLLFITRAVLGYLVHG